MDSEITAPRSRRALLAAAVGGAAAAIAATVTRVVPAAASDGDDLKAGENVKATKLTSVTNDENDNTVFAGRSEKGIGLHGKSTDKDGVFGESDGGGAGVSGTSSGGPGVSGGSQSGPGVSGTSFSGNGVVASSMNGHALSIEEGSVHLKGLSGVATIAGGDTTHKVEPAVGVNGKTFVLLTPEENIGSRALWFTRDTDNGSFTIHLSESRSNDTKVAWVAFDHG